MFLDLLHTAAESSLLRKGSALNFQLLSERTSGPSEQAAMGELIAESRKQQKLLQVETESRKVS